MFDEIAKRETVSMKIESGIGVEDWCEGFVLN